MTTEWVLRGEHKNFPLMYHQRIFKNFEVNNSFDEEKMNEYIAYWDNSEEIANRMKANKISSDYIFLFIEYFPETLNQWLTKQLSYDTNSFDNAIRNVEENLNEIITFINNKEMLHFDAHFHNIVTDGESFYLTDFGLTTSPHFIFAQEEVNFFHEHRNYDKYYIVITLTNWLISRLFGKGFLEEILEKYSNGISPEILPQNVTPYIHSLLMRDAPLAFKMFTFFKKLQETDKKTIYPREELDLLWLKRMQF